MLVYRMEAPDKISGPYDFFLWSNTRKEWPTFYRHASDSGLVFDPDPWPGPMKDGLGLQKADEYSCFQSVQQCIDWFFSHNIDRDLRAYDRAGMVILTIDAPDQLIRHGGRQSVVQRLHEQINIVRRQSAREFYEEWKSQNA